MSSIARIGGMLFYKNGTEIAPGTGANNFETPTRTVMYVMAPSPFLDWRLGGDPQIYQHSIGWLEREF